MMLLLQELTSAVKTITVRYTPLFKCSAVKKSRRTSNSGSDWTVLPDTSTTLCICFVIVLCTFQFSQNISVV